MSKRLPDRSEVRVLVVDDSAFMRTAISRMVHSEAGFLVVGTASSGTDALAKIPALDPDVVTLDLNMPAMDGLETLRKIMNRFPRPVVIVSAASEKNADITMKALSAGAFDYVPKQLSPTSLEIAHIRSELVAKIRAASHSCRLHFPDLPPRKPPHSAIAELRPSRVTAPTIMAIACSTGGPKALEQILPCFPREFPLPILIVQHMPVGFTRSLAQRLQSLCSVEVKEATENEELRSGVAYICPAGLHMRVTRARPGAKVLTSLDREPAQALHMPSADVLMTSVAKIYGNRALGVVLTGMGSDGVQGMEAIYRAGGLTIGQDEASCTVYGMPRACAELGILTRTLPLLEIPGEILRATRHRKPA